MQAIEVEGTFDDCQRLVKAAFADKDFEVKSFWLSQLYQYPRLLPQMVYYFEAFKQTSEKQYLNIIVPSGNFGNLTAGLFAKKMGAQSHDLLQLRISTI